MSGTSTPRASNGGGATAASGSPPPSGPHATSAGARGAYSSDEGEAPTAEAPPLFTQVNVRKPEYWQFARLIAPAARLPEGKKAWTTQDATGIWCLRCAKSLNYQKGSSQSIRYHMETRHFEALMSFREQLQRAKVEGTSAVPAKASSKGRKRKFDEQQESSDSPLLAMASPPAAACAQSAYTTQAKVSTPSEAHLTNPPHAAHLATPPVPAPVAAPALTQPVIAPVPTQPVASTVHGPPTASPVQAPPVVSPPPPSESWSRNVERRGGFWGNAYWYDLQLSRRMPLAERTVAELVLALPPCDGKRVLDVCAGSGRASAALLDAYPTASVVLLDVSSERLSIASKRLAAKGLTGQFETVARAVDVSDASAPPLLPRPVDVVMGCLAFHVLVERPRHYADGAGASALSVPEQYERLFRSIWASLKPGGHVLFGDHVGQLALFEQLQALARVGFVDVDCAWRQDDSFVAGARKPLL